MRDNGFPLAHFLYIEIIRTFRCMGFELSVYPQVYPHAIYSLPAPQFTRMLFIVYPLRGFTRYLPA